ncbi:MAG: response regulator [Chloroflexi bacterium]|nr:response regulator [Chloroflexota bacterium]
MGSVLVPVEPLLHRLGGDVSSGSSPAEQPTPKASEVQTAAQASKTGVVLVVDDDPSIVELVVEILEAEGYPVEQASNGAEALAMIDRIRPALVLLDMRMPVLDGWGFARAVRERGIPVPIVVMTAAQDAGRWAEEIAAGGALAKPFEISELLAMVTRFAGTP